MDKELTDKAPPFAKLVDDVARSMETCGDPNRTFSMMDEYENDQVKDRCYVNPFVGEGRYAKYLRLWLETTPSAQLMLLNFDEWTSQVRPPFGSDLRTCDLWREDRPSSRPLA